jgi:type I restriction enzyme S subunit
MSARELITDHLDLWTGAITSRSTAGRGRNGKIELTGIKKLRELILELAVRGKLVEQDPSDEPASVLLARIAEEKARLVKEGKIKKPKKLPEITEEDRPFELPDSWSWAMFPEIAHYNPGKTPSTKDAQFWTNNTSGTPWVSIADMIHFGRVQKTSKLVTEAAAKQVFRTEPISPGCILMSFKLTVGKISINDIPVYHNEAIISITPFKGINRDYLFKILPMQALGGNTKKAIMGNTLNAKSLAQILIPVPPEKEQDRIVEKVDELMALCDRLEQQVGDQLEAHEVLVDTLLDALTRSADATEVAENWARIAEHFDTLFTTEISIDKLKQAILQLAVMGRLVEQDPNDEPASVLLERIAEEKVRLVKEGKIRKQKPLPEIAHDEYPFEIPSGWAMSRMDDITNIISGIAKGKKLSGKKAVWVPYLRVANVQRGALDLSEVKEIEMACDEVEKYTVEKRDLLITEGGDWDKVGRTAIWNADIKPMTHQNHVFRARLILGEQNEHWIEKYLNSGIAREYFANSSKQTTNLASINKTQLRSCIVPVPPLDEQQRIVDKVDELMALCDQLKNRLAEAGATRTHLAEAVVEQAVN